jgi:hypothetical protein
MSLGQGADYFKYHQGQHGGMTSDANMSGAPLSAISGSMLPKGLQAAAHINGTMDALTYASQFKDQAGGRRCKCGKKRCKCRKSHCKHHRHHKCRSHRKSRSHHKRRTHKKRGGNLDFAPFPNKGMLLDSQKEYAQAGLNPQWKTDVAFDMAEVRSKQ